MRYQLNNTGLEDIKKRARKAPEQFALLAYCNNCSAELLGYWKGTHIFRYKDELVDKIRAVSQITQCPVCRKKLLKDAGFYLEIKITEVKPEIDVDVEFEKMRQIRNTQEELKAENLVEALCEQLDASDQSQCDVQKRQRILNTVESLKTYLQQIIKIESNIVFQRKYLILLYVRNEENEREQIYYQKILASQHEKQIDSAKDLYKQCKKKLIEEQEKPTPIFKEKMPKKPIEPDYKKPNLFNRKRVLEENKQLQEAYCIQLNEYNLKYAEYKKKKAQFPDVAKQRKEKAILEAQTRLTQAQEKVEQLKAEKAEIIKAGKIAPSPAKAKKKLLNKEITEAENTLKKLLDCRRALYDTNILFPKYRNIIAVSTFFEYLCAGRCDTLEGTYGAYNLYETECRANLIISQLNQIFESLEQIKNNQLTIYNELQAINVGINELASSIDSLERSLQDIKCDTTDMKGYMHAVSQNSSIIAHNTAVAAHYSKINAELTNSLGYLIALN